MSLRAVIFDVYKTLLEVGPAPEDAEDRWRRLWQEQLSTPPRVTLPEFDATCQPIIAREHATARLAGIPFPEIYWPAVTAEALPALAQLPPALHDDFLFRHAQMVRTLRLAPEAAETLVSLQGRGIPMGIASNAQPYTLREVDAALAVAGLNRELFRADLCFWSFDHGFSKPDPHVFRLLTARLACTGISCTETLMVGDRIDNDILPARAQGWLTWHLDPGADGATGGGWEKLRGWLKELC
jgi:FMN phosphatase YigB (HAD superfamily)